MSYALNCGSGYMPGGLRMDAVPGDEETAEREECLGCGMTECICHEHWDDEDESLLREGMADFVNDLDEEVLIE